MAVLDPEKTLLFDIEAGGLSGYRSSLLSIAYQHLSTGKGEELAASPAEGSWISKWSETQVWERIKKTLPIQKEQEILGKFLNVLEKHAETPGATLAGWNIGYTALSQNPEEMQRMRGFDIPMLMTRAKKYGLEERYQKIFQKLRIRDVGQEWAAKISEIVSKPQYEGKVDPDLYAQAVGFRKALRGAGLEGADIPSQARYMGTTGYKFAGWKQESVYQLMGLGEYSAHMAGEDVSALRRMLLSKEGITDESKFVEHWNRLALTNKLTATARYGGKSLQEIQEYAARSGLNVSELTGKIEDLAKASGATLEDVGMGRGIPEVWSKVGGGEFASRPAASIFGKIARGVGGHVMRHKMGYGIAAGIGLLYLSKPLSLFSGKDDEHNTIEGMRHGGMAERMRRMLTEFGSGWIKPTIMTLDDVIPILLKESKEGRDLIAQTKSDFYNQFSGKDDEYNTLEGLRHGWWGKQRKYNTDFGSGWIREALKRGIAKATIAEKWVAGKAGTGIYGNLTKEKFIEKALATKTEEGFTRFLRSSHRVQGETEKFLVTEQYKAGGMGQTFKLRGLESNRPAIYKTSLPGINQPVAENEMMLGPHMTKAIEEVAQGDMFAGMAQFSEYTSEYNKQIYESIKKYGGGMRGPQYEATMQRMARQQYGDLVPEVLGETKRGFIQEFAGVEMPQGAQGTMATYWGLESAKKVWERLIIGSNQGIRHFDPQIRNVVRQGSKLRVIDWMVAADGGALSAKSVEQAKRALDIYTKAEQREITSSLKAVKQNVAPVPDIAKTRIKLPKSSTSAKTLNISKPPRYHMDKIDQSNLQKVASANMSSTGKYGGRGHTTGKKF